jgi:DNA-binding XRE family transcriptional regulator
MNERESNAIETHKEHARLKEERRREAMSGGARMVLDARTALGLTQDALGRALGLSRAMIVAMERGRRPVQRVTELAIGALRHFHCLHCFDALPDVCPKCLVVHDSQCDSLESGKKLPCNCYQSWPCHRGGVIHNWKADGTCTDCVCAKNPPQNPE